MPARKKVTLEQIFDKLTDETSVGQSFEKVQSRLARIETEERPAISAETLRQEYLAATQCLRRIEDKLDAMASTLRLKA